MRGSKQAPGFLEGVAVALVLTVFGGALHVSLRLLILPVVAHGFAPADARLMTIIAISLCYLLYLLWRSRETAGRISIAVLWACASLPVLLLAPDWTLPVQLALLWFTRALFLQRGFSAALADLVLVVVGLGAGLWAIAATGNLAAAIWTFLLVQAPFAVVGNFMPAADGPENRNPIDDDRFERAERSAQSSLHRLAGAAGRR